MFFMLLLCSRIDENIIYENNYKLIQIRSKDSVHIIHKNSRGISQSKRHHGKLIMPIPCSKSRFGYILLLHSYLMISRSQIDLREHSCTSQLVHKVIYPRQRILVLNRHFVQLPIIHTQPHATIFLFHEQHRGSPR